MARTAATRRRHTIRAEKLSGQLQHVKAPAAFAHGIFGWLGWFGFHFERAGGTLVPPKRIQAFPKLSASAMALRMDMDLFTVS